MTIEELVDVISCELTVSGALPKLLPDVEIMRIVEFIAVPWFHQHYNYSLQRAYYYIPKDAFDYEPTTNYIRAKLPCTVQNVIWLYEVKNRSLFNLGLNAPNLSVNIGVSNTPYLTSYVSTIAELGLYKSVLDNFSDMLDQFSKFTLKHDYNENTHDLHVLTNTKYDLVAECYVQIPNENLFDDPMFIKYVIGYAKKQLGNLMTRYDFTLPGNVKYNGADLKSEGVEEMNKIEEEFKGMSNSSFIFMVKK